MNPYIEFEDYLNDGKVIEITPVDILINSAKYINFYHPIVEQKFLDGSLGAVKYSNTCTYIFYNNITKEFYIGSGDRDIRKNRHLRLLEAGRQRKVNKFGVSIKHANWRFQLAYNRDQNFKLTTLSMIDNKNALAFEQILIDHFWGDPLFLNLAKVVTAPMSGRRHTGETKQLMSLNRQGEKHPMFGKTHSLETRQKQSTAKKGEPPSLQCMAASVSYHTGRKQTSEHVEKRIAPLRGIGLSFERRTTISSTLRKLYQSGYKHPMLGKKQSIATAINNGLTHSKPVVIDGSSYSSLSLAATDLKIPFSTMHARLNNVNYKNYNYAL